MTQIPKRPRDLNQWAKRMVDIATREATDREQAPGDLGKDPTDFRPFTRSLPLG